MKKRIHSVIASLALLKAKHNEKTKSNDTYQQTSVNHRRIPLISVISFIFFLIPALKCSAASGCKASPTYCTPQGNTNIYANGYITEFKITDPFNLVLIDQVATAQASCCNYIDNTGVGTPNLTQGVTYTISGSRKDIDFFNAWQYGMNIWIDYNDDGTFNNNGGNVEVVYKEGTSNVEAFSFSYTIPVSGITTGIHRLRIRSHYNDANPDPCADYTDGTQGMDFLVNIVCSHTEAASAGNDSAVCAGATIDLTSTATAGNSPFSYSWCGPNSFTSALQNPAITGVVLADSGTYIVTVTDSNGCVSTASMNISIANSANASALSNGPVCPGGTLNLSGGGGTSYLWSGPDGFSSTLQNPVIGSVTSADSGIYTVTVTVGGACTATASAAVSITPPFTANALSSGTACDGTVDSLFSSGGLSYSWTGPDNFTSSQQDPVIPNTVSADTGIYIVTVTAAGGCTATATVDVSVYAPVNPPSIDQFGDALVCTDTTFTAYQWYANTMPINGATLPVLIVTKGGNYNIQVTDKNGCTVAVGINVTLTGITESFMQGADNPLISIAPNPCISRLTLHSLFSSTLQAAEVRVINMLGQMILSPPLLQPGGKDASIDISMLDAGIYFVQIRSGNLIVVKKFIKE